MHATMDAIIREMQELQADSSQTARDAADAGNTGQAEYERGRADAYAFLLSRLTDAPATSK